MAALMDTVMGLVHQAGGLLAQASEVAQGLLSALPL
jgi:hypothetical protein